MLKNLRCTSDDVDFDDLMYDKFEISMEQFHKIAEALSDFTVPMQAGISGKMFRGFVSFQDYPAVSEQEFNRIADAIVEQVNRRH